MMDIKDIIKWFIPCFHILLIKMKKLDWKLTLVCLFLFFNSCIATMANVSDVSSENVTESTKNLVNSSSFEENSSFNESERDINYKFGGNESRSLADASVGRTFGRPFKKMIAGLLPVIFQVGAASTWAVVAAIVGFKTLLVTLVILKLLLLAGAAKFGALFASKGHQIQPHQPAWQPPHQKEIHLHIYNGHGHEHEEHVPVSSWSRDGSAQVKGYSHDPYRAGPQTISTPFGNYMKIEPGPPVS